ncbi:hypothetical protein L4D76_24905 [Photobacterium sagamiensis]|uniref:hypothetical protein n=1 Tax=Photobacterium sagamiensis TaxID=2910241 RepID=UPI003D0C0728
MTDATDPTATNNCIEFYYDYKKSRGDISNVFHAMGEYIAAYEIIEKAIIQNLEIKVKPGLTIEKIEIASLEAWINRGLNWLAPSSIVADISGDGNERKTFKDISKRANENLRNECANSPDFFVAVNNGSIPEANAEAFLNGNLEAVTDFDIAKAGQHVSIANKKYYRSGESIILFPDGRKSGHKGHKVDTSFQMDRSLDAIFSGFQEEFDGEEHVDVISPVQIGSGKWKLKSRTETGYLYETDIQDTEWLKRFQEDSKRIASLLVEICYEVWVDNGERKVKKPVVTKVLDQWWAEDQRGLF